MTSPGRASRSDGVVEGARVSSRPTPSQDSCSRAVRVADLARTRGCPGPSLCTPGSSCEREPTGAVLQGRIAGAVREDVPAPRHARGPLPEQARLRVGHNPDGSAIHGSLVDGGTPRKLAGSSPIPFREEAGRQRERNLILATPAVGLAIVVKGFLAGCDVKLLERQLLDAMADGPPDKRVDCFRGLDTAFLKDRDDPRSQDLQSRRLDACQNPLRSDIE